MATPLFNLKVRYAKSDELSSLIRIIRLRNRVVHIELRVDPQGTKKYKSKQNYSAFKLSLFNYNHHTFP